MEMSGHFQAPAAVPIANEAGWPPELVNCFEMWWHTGRNQISYFGETVEPI